MHFSSFEEGPSLLTRPSLLHRLRDWKDGVSWEEFHRLYHQMVYGMARRNGLTHTEAEDVAQEVFKRVAETIQSFESIPRRGSFRRWLMNLTQWRIRDYYRRLPPAEAHRLPRPKAPPAPGQTSTIERLADPSPAGAAEWESDWHRSVFDTALERVARRTPPRHFQAFELHVRHGWTPAEIARHLELSAASVYLINHRLSRMLQAEADVLRQQVG